MTWLIENYIDEDINVKISFSPTSPFKKLEYEEEVNDYSSSNGPGVDEIRKKIRKNTTVRSYKYTISTDLSGIKDIDPELEVEGDTITPDPE